MGFLKAPTLKHLSLEIHKFRSFEANWAVLTSIKLRGKSHDDGHTRNELARILQQTKHLILFEVVVGVNRTRDEIFVGNIMLPFLETLYITETTFSRPAYGAASLLDLITTPALTKLCIRATFVVSTFSAFLQRAPRITHFSLPYLPKDLSLTDTQGYLRWCPELAVLNLRPYYWGEYNRPIVRDANSLLRAFVGDDKAGGICPRLQYIRFFGDIDVSLETLQLFVNGKHGENAFPDLMPWKRVVMGSKIIKDKDTRPQALNFISRKKEEGLDLVVGWDSDTAYYREYRDAFEY